MSAVAARFGIIPGLIAPHIDAESRLEPLKQMLSRVGGWALGADNCAAIVYRNGTARCITSRPDARIHLLRKTNEGISHRSFGHGEKIPLPADETSIRQYPIWNAGQDPLICSGYVRPPDNIEYFLKSIYDSTRRNGGERPDAFDSAWLLRRYRSEFTMPGIPAFVQKVIFPVQLFIGSLAGKSKRFADAPEPVRR